MILNTKKIVFIQPPVSLEDIYYGLAKVAAVSPPLNLLLLAAVVRERNYQPAIIDCPAFGLNSSNVINQLKSIKPKFIGLTAMTPHIIQAAILAKKIKEALPQAIIVLGGTHISSMPEETLHRFPNIDIGVIGEAEYTLPELLDGINSGIPLSSIRGIIYRNHNNLTITEPRNENIDLDKLPIYAWDILPGFPRQYKPPIFSAHRTPAVSIITSRGCPGHCIFCYSGCHKTLATYSAEYIITMLNHLKKKYKIKEFMIYDDNFIMYRNNLVKLLNFLIKEKANLSWSCNARVDMVDEEILILMKKAGCWQIAYGIETGNEDILKKIGKNITKNKIAESIELTHKAGIRSVGYFMIGHFGETKQTIKDTINFALSLKLDDFRISFFTPLPGTKASLMADNYGKYENNWSKMTLFTPVFIPNGLSKEYLINAQKEAIKKFFFRTHIFRSYLKMVLNPIKALKGAFFLSRYILK